ncbi:hypothetical protein [Sphingobacterium suaedae]|uniref:Uncharacterized protein n=1 Tax=Sphingobacterium suaedae TaxID=1686402 RepID=A0ABW5KJI7_9SPHI
MNDQEKMAQAQNRLRAVVDDALMLAGAVYGLIDVEGLNHV